MSASLSKPIVAIVIPSGDVIPAEPFIHTINLVMTSVLAGVKTVVVNPRCSLVHLGRNQGVDAVRAVGGATHLFFLDSDMKLPRNALLRLLAHDVDVVGATYPHRVAPYCFNHQDLDCDGSKHKGQLDQEETCLREVNRIGTGCLLIRMTVFDKVPRPWFQTPLLPSGDIQGEDYFFCDAVRAKGGKIWMDPTVSREIGHLGLHEVTCPDAWEWQRLQAEQEHA